MATSVHSLGAGEHNGRKGGHLRELYQTQERQFCRYTQQKNDEMEQQFPRRTGGITLKKRRQEAILEIIEKYDLSTQDELLQKLKDSGFDATQATVRAI